MNLLRFEIKRKFTALLWWSLGLGSLQLMMLSFFPLMAENQSMWDLILTYYPPEMLAAFGLANAASLGNIEGYLIFSFIFAQVALAIFASLEGFNALSAEESENIADFLLTKPISRTHVFMMKVTSALILMAILSLMTALSTLLGIVWFASDTSLTLSLLLLFLSLLPLQWLFYVSALLISQFMANLRSPTTLAMGLAFGMYFLYGLGAAIESDVLRYFTYFNYIDLSLILNQKPFEVSFIILAVLIGLGACLLSYQLYLRRNIVSK